MSPATILSKRISNGSIDMQYVVFSDWKTCVYIRIRNIINPISSLQLVFLWDLKQAKAPEKGTVYSSLLLGCSRGVLRTSLLAFRLR
jgi:hypothetical protein